MSGPGVGVALSLPPSRGEASEIRMFDRRLRGRDRRRVGIDQFCSVCCRSYGGLLDHSTARRRFRNNISPRPAGRAVPSCARAA